MKIMTRLKNKLKRLLLKISLVMAVILSGNVHADDTEVFLGVTTNTIGVKPNVLFILDTSGSMGGQIGGGDSTIRMVAMKNAMTQILASSNNLNIGLMSFNGRGGPVRLPVRDIDAPLSVNNGYQVVRNIVDSNDDAQEIDDSSSAEDGQMDLDSPVVYLSEGPAVSASTTTINIPIATASDDANQLFCATRSRSSIREPPVDSGNGLVGDVDCRIHRGAVRDRQPDTWIAGHRGRYCTGEEVE